MAALTDVVAAVQARLAGLPGVVFLPETPPENLSVVQLPALLVYPSSGGWGLGTARAKPGQATRDGMHTITVDLHVQRKNLAVDMATAMPYADSIPLRLIQGFRDDRFDGTVAMLGDPGETRPIRYDLADLRWGGMKTIGWRFQMDVRVIEDL